MEHKCPNDLEILLVNLPAIIFDSLSDEPDRKDIEEVVRDRHPNATQEIIDDHYRYFVRDYDMNQQIAFRLSRYGKTREEIRDNLRKEVSGCLECSLKYLKMISEFAASKIELKDSKCEVVAEVGRRCKEEGFFKILADIDEDCLGLLQ